MKYFFILGNNPALSAAEIISVLRPEKDARLAAGNVLLLENPATDAAKLIKRLGGTIKIGVIAATVDRHNNEAIKTAILKIIEDDLSERGETNKYRFGLSLYGQSKLPVFPIGLAVKKILKQKGVSCRLVTSKEKTLSSVVVEQNIISKRGIEIVLIEDGGQMHLGYTEAVQPFKELSFRDFGRPKRDDQSGMIPPKLAQIMLNLSGKIDGGRSLDVTHPVPQTHPGCEAQPPLPRGEAGHPSREGTSLLDPFCGSGTILMEAALMGVKNLIGSDISEKAISDTKKNFAWLGEKISNIKYQISNIKLFDIPAAEISQKVAANSIDAIVTEPYLGPQRGHIDPIKTKIELEKLYSAALAEFKKILKPDGRVVMIFPVRTEGERPDWHFINPNLDGWQVINPLPENLRQNLHATRRGTIVYGRSGQKVWREIVILDKKPKSF
ncbi:MAG: methyltransferase domain-containing protein [Patescibacteria group bacterium]|nr:methyltransferase domain-containing protein [Patescibacteria group bacterium]